jgi:hypothetical protein
MPSSSNHRAARRAPAKQRKRRSRSKQMPLLHDNIDCGAPANSDACTRHELCSLRPACSCAGGGGLVRPSHELRPLAFLGAPVVHLCPAGCRPSQELRRSPTGFGGPRRATSKHSSSSRDEVLPACGTGAALELTPRRAFVAWTEADEPACSTTAEWPPAHAATAPRKL